MQQSASDNIFGFIYPSVVFLTNQTLGSRDTILWSFELWYSAAPQWNESWEIEKRQTKEENR